MESSNAAIVRPRVDVVVPFRGELAQLEDLRCRLERLRLRDGDTVLVVDNTPRQTEAHTAGNDVVSVVSATSYATPGFARNRGTAHGTADWIVFLDADTEPAPNLLDLYFDPPPEASTGLLAGGVLDEPVSSRGPAAARYAYLQDAMSQRQTFRLNEWAFSQMANAACRRVAFETLGGFREDIRAGEDADFCYRLRLRRWGIERREHARVVHRNRQTIPAFIAQKALHGSGAAWLNRAYPGSFPARRRHGLVWWGVRHSARGLLSAIRHRNFDEAVLAVFDPLEQLSFEFGRSLPNVRSARPFA
jgi:GT2 family glycosyltransferase